jgi:hypothetical protein
VTDRDVAEIVGLTKKIFQQVALSLGFFCCSLFLIVLSFVVQARVVLEMTDIMAGVELLAADAEQMMNAGSLIAEGNHSLSSFWCFFPRMPVVFFNPRVPLAFKLAAVELGRHLEEARLIVRPGRQTTLSEVHLIVQAIALAAKRMCDAVVNPEAPL